MFGVHKDAGRIAQSCFLSFNDAGRRLIALVGLTENQNGVADVVGDVQIAGCGIQRNSVRPIQLGFFTLNDTQRFDIAGGVEGIDRNGWKLESSWPCDKVVADGSQLATKSS